MFMKKTLLGMYCKGLFLNMFSTDYMYCPLFIIDFQVEEAFVRSTRNTPPPCHSITHRPQNFLGNSTVVSIRNVTQSNNKNMDKLNHNQNLLEVTEKPWIPTTNNHFSTATKQVSY